MFHNVDLILIASSTGGPNALEVVFKELSGDIKQPILVVQHMPAEFTKLMSESLDRKSALEISEAKDSEVLRGGHAYVAPGGLHMTLKGRDNAKFIRLENTPMVNGVRPAADVLFSSIAKNFPKLKVLVVVMTGMGSDGMKGIIDMKASCECYCITQSEKTCVVYGMPKSVFEKGLSDETADLKDIAQRINRIATIL